MPQSSDAYFYVVRFPSHITQVARSLYDDLDSSMAREFLHINQLASDQSGWLMTGQMLYLPEPVCYHPDIESEVIRLVGAMNEKIRYGMDNEQRRIIAEHPTFVANAAEVSNDPYAGVDAANSLAGALTAATSSYARSVGQSLTELDAAYKRSYQAHGRLTDSFYQQRQQIYRTLDTRMGRMGRTLAFGTAFDSQARNVLKVKTKSQILHWQRHGVGSGPMNDFRTHFDRFDRASRNIRRVGYVSIGIEVTLSELTIREECSAGSSEDCTKSKFLNRGQTTGAVAGGMGGSALATYGVCNALFGIKSFGSSLLWCSLVAGGSGAYAGAELGKPFGRGLGTLAYFTRRRLER